MLKIPRPVVSKTLLVTVGSTLVTAAAYLPAPWSLVAAAVGGLLGGKALLQRPGDMKAPHWMQDAPKVEQ